MELQYYFQYILSWIYHNVLTTDASFAILRILLFIGLVSLLVYREYVLFTLLCIVIIAAEIAAKLLLAGRLNDPTLIAWLVLLYFDSSLAATAEEEDVDDGGAEEAAKKVGSPVRLQQVRSSRHFYFLCMYKIISFLIRVSNNIPSSIAAP